MKPFLKWAGGKNQLLKEIRNYYPFMNKNITKYAEPFVGGGAVLFDILLKYDLEEFYISDINKELIDTYQVIRDNPNKLVKILSNMQMEFISLTINDRKNYYLQKRERFNFLKVNDNEAIEKAALMIFLNRTCFNGLFRVNKKGLFNVPMGAYKNPLICDKENIYAVSEKLKNVNIVCGDSANFTAYTIDLFDDDKQRELANFVHSIHKKGAKILISNSDPKNTDANDDFFDTIYKDYNIKRVEAARMINCNGKSRNKIKELLISNFRRD